MSRRRSRTGKKGPKLVISRGKPRCWKVRQTIERWMAAKGAGGGGSGGNLLGQTQCQKIYDVLVQPETPTCGGRRSKGAD